MLRLSRSIYTSRRCLQQTVDGFETNPVAIAKEEIDAYVQYFRTPKDLRPLVYREKNASDLLSRDLWDEVAKKRVVPLEPPKVPDRSALGKLISHATNADELYATRDLLTELSKKPNYTNPYHVNIFLEKSAELRKFPHALTYIYTQKALRERLSAQNLNFVLFFIYINDRKSLLNALSKVQVAEEKIRKTSEVSDLLKASLYLKHNSEIPVELKESIKTAPETTVPQLDITKSLGALAKEFNTHRFTYLVFSPIAIELAKDVELQQLGNVQKIFKFISEFKQLQEKLQLKDAFASVKGKSVFRRPPQPAQVPKTENKPEEEA
jgi:hypothetical protein